MGKDAVGGGALAPPPTAPSPCVCQIGGGLGRRLAGYGLNRVAGMSRRRRDLPRMGSRLDATRELTQAIQGSPAHTSPDRPWMAVANPSIAPQAFVTRGRSRRRRDPGGVTFARRSRVMASRRPAKPHPGEQLAWEALLRPEVAPTRCPQPRHAPVFAHLLAGADKSVARKGWSHAGGQPKVSLEGI
jgi:hypothetical protein